MNPTPVSIHAITQPSPTEERLLSGLEVRAMFGIKHRATLRTWRKEGLRSFGVGKRARYLRSDVLAFLDRAKTSQSPGH